MSTSTNSNDERIRGAMERLLAGTPIHTDGKLHIKNLAEEAGLSRQQVYRSALFLEFKEHVARLREHNVEPSHAHLKRIASLQEQLGAEREKAARYRTERDKSRAFNSALANQVQLLDAQLELATAGC